MQRYISKELIHFIGRGKSPEEQYNILKTILTEKKVGIGSNDELDLTIISGKNKLSSNEVYTSRMICFCDIPIDDLKIHMKKYSQFGISFLKEFLISKGASPIWYISKKSSTRHAITETNADYHNKKYQEFRDLNNAIRKRIKQNDESEDTVTFKKIDSFFSYLHSYIFPFMVFFDAQKEEDDKENYYMEREWRIYGVLYFKRLDNICRIILPKLFAKKFRKDFPKYTGQISYDEIS